ncbi:hypothetical protein ILUMI_08340 [Ignelater luminosus]|uniref:CCHC-type domain-containing protein n=1 Tax=Ignelater luminosus TaxID=2038154 RepID=A0A8K0GFI0_IGNLU|nr:hypothetical protein ILUMI_08340 [Ignelater luminosus]
MILKHLVSKNIKNFNTQNFNCKQQQSKNYNSRNFHYDQPSTLRYQDKPNNTVQRCFKCNRPGHTQRYCRSNPNWRNRYFRNPSRNNLARVAGNSVVGDGAETFVQCRGDVSRNQYKTKGSNSYLRTGPPHTHELNGVAERIEGDECTEDTDEHVQDDDSNETGQKHEIPSKTEIVKNNIENEEGANSSRSRREIKFAKRFDDHVVYVNYSNA